MINLLKNKISLFAKILIFIFMSIMIVIAFKGIQYYNYIYTPSISVDGNSSFLYIGSSDTFDDVTNQLKQNFNLKNEKAFRWVAKMKKYDTKIKKGRYLLQQSMTNNDMVNLLRSGRQTPVNLTFNNTRTIEEFAGKIASQIDIDSLEFVNVLRNKANFVQFGFNEKNIISMFIPNTYHVYWHTDINSFLKRMNKEYRHFWSLNNMKKAQKLNLTPIEVGILASIVDEETIKVDEKCVVAGVYLNRLRIGMRLDADPTLKFAANDFTLRRVLNVHKKIDSPYNTYMYAGLPPGPIRQPSISGLNSVLNPTKHKYIFFCAKSDFSGYHAFARSLSLHNRNARKYQRALNNKRIYK